MSYTGRKLVPRAQIVSPTVVQRPEIDSMLGRTAYIAGRILEYMQDTVDNADGTKLPFDRRELKDFKEICETVMRQAKLEMEIENHRAQKDDGMSQDEIRQAITSALHQKGLGQEVVEAVLDALEMHPPTHEYTSQVSVSV